MNQQPQWTPAEDEINLVEVWHVLKRYRHYIVRFVIAATCLAAIVSFFLPKTYKAQATITTVSDKGSGGLGALAGQLGGLASIAGISAQSDETTKLMAILKSRTLAEHVIKRENLMPVLFSSKWDETKHAWRSSNPEKQPTIEDGVALLKKKNMRFVHSKKESTIEISGIFKTPELAAQVVNAYLAELQKFINSNAFTVAKRNRLFIERQMEQNKEDLLQAGKDIAEFYKDGTVSNTEAKIDVPVEMPSVPETTAARIAGEQGMEELEALLSQSETLERKIAAAKVVKDVPQQVYLTYLMMRRELLAKVNGLLTTQYEMAKIEEAKQDLAFQVIDAAVPPKKKFGPQRKMIVLGAFFASLMIGIFYALIRDYLEKMRNRAAPA